MNQDDHDSLDIYDVDMLSIPKEKKREIIEQHIKYIKLSRSVVGATSSYISNIRTLLLQLFVVMSLAILGFDNKNIIMIILFLQFLKTLISRMLEVNLVKLLDLVKVEMTNFITSTIKNNKNG